MPDHPLAYFITFHTYGTWLHGQDSGSVDDSHNEYGAPTLPADSERLAECRSRMTQEAYVLDEPRRTMVRDAIVAECRFLGWQLHAVHVRSNHVHLVVSAEREIDFVLRSCKAHASKCLNEAGFDHPQRKRWTVHVSTRYLWNEDAVVERIDYTLNQQGAPMALFARQQILN